MAKVRRAFKLTSYCLSGKSRIRNHYGDGNNGRLVLIDVLSRLRSLTCYFKKDKLGSTLDAERTHWEDVSFRPLQRDAEHSAVQPSFLRGSSTSRWLA